MSSFVPGRRRPDDPDSRAHARAIRLIAERLSEPLHPEEDAWLGGHLAACGACSTVADEYEADSRLLRSMPVPEAPRDLWARTAAAIEAERSSSFRRVPSLIPLGALSGALVVAVVIGAALLSSPGVPPVTPTSQPLPSSAIASMPPAATPIAVAAAEVGWVTQRADGSYSVTYAPVKRVCAADIKPDCPPLAAASPVALALDTAPGAIVGAPDAKQLVVVDSKTKTTGGGLTVVDVGASAASPAPSPTASASAGASASPLASPSATAPASASPTSPAPSPSPATSPSPGSTPSASPSSSPAPGTVVIAQDVVVVGETGAYSPDGRWFAFSARPSDSSQGPDIYVWSRGDGAAHAVTRDHRSVFAGWSGGNVIGSRAVVEPLQGGPTASPGASDGPSIAPLPTPPPSPSGGDASPSASDLAGPSPVIATPVSFVLDPATGATAVIPGDAMWRPVVDQTGTYAAYWHGTLRLAEDGVDWLPDSGQLVVARWPGAGIQPPPVESPVPPASGDPSASASISPAPSSSPSPSPLPSSSPSELSPGDASPSASPPAGTLPVALTDGPVRDWDVRWDESGTRLAVWLADPVDATVGALALHTLDRASDILDPQGILLDEQPALAGFSIGSGRLAWATPPGQGGEGSRVVVLAWSGESAGRIESQPGSGPGPVVVIR